MGKKRANGEGSIRKRKDGRWEGFYTASYDPVTGKQKIKTGKNRLKADADTGVSSPPHKIAPVHHSAGAAYRGAPDTISRGLRT